jgi:hypothetical protein
MPFDSLSITSPAIEALRKGRALIEERGLARAILEDYNGRFCAVGAITRQSRTLELGMAEALDYLAKAIPADLCAIAAWNDDPDRTIADVIAAYDRAINLAIEDRLR